MTGAEALTIAMRYVGSRPGPDEPDWLAALRTLAELVTTIDHTLEADWFPEEMEVDATRHLCGGCSVDTQAIGEYYMVRDEVWEQAVPPADRENVMLCIGCLETLLGRLLNLHDFSSAPVNLTALDEGSDRLRDRLTRQ